MVIVTRDAGPQGGTFFFRLGIRVLLLFSLLRGSQTALGAHTHQSHPGQPAGRSALALRAPPARGQASQLYSRWAQAPFPRPGRVQLPGPWLWGVIVNVSINTDFYNVYVGESCKRKYTVGSTAPLFQSKSKSWRSVSQGDLTHKSRLGQILLTFIFLTIC